MRQAHALAIVVWMAGCTGAVGQAQLANPASQRCVASGGSLQIEQRPDGGQLGVCVFEDNRQCEEWALFRGDCPAGGLRVTGYLTPAARFCAIAGGRYDDARSVCILPSGKTCSADSYYSGSCP